MPPVTSVVRDYLNLIDTGDSFLGFGGRFPTVNKINTALEFSFPSSFPDDNIPPVMGFVDSNALATLATVGGNNVIVAESVGVYNSFPVAITCADGTQLIAYRVGSSHILDGEIWIKRYENGAWQASTKVLAKVSSTDQWEAVTLHLLRSGRILLYARKFGDFSTRHMILSDDNGDNWSAPVELSIPPGLNGMPTPGEHGSKIIELLDGTMIVLGHTSVSGEGDTSIVCIQSTDGAAWTVRGYPMQWSVDNIAGNEPSMVQLLDSSNTLLAVYRTGTNGAGLLYYSKSTDNGENWTDPASIGFKGQAPVMCRLTDGKIILAYREQDDLTLCLRVSLDGGDTWGAEYVLNDYSASGDSGDGAYCGITQIANNKLKVVYYTADVSGDPWIQENVLTLNLSSSSNVFTDISLIHRGSGGIFQYRDNDTTEKRFSVQNNSGHAFLELYNNSDAQKILLDTNGTSSIQGVKIDTNSNLGVGTTPASDWETGVNGRSAIQVGVGGVIAATNLIASPAVFFNNNTKHNLTNGDVYIVDGFAARMVYGSSGQIVFQVGPSGVADAVISWVDRFQMDQTGIGFFGATPIAKQAHIVDADGTLADITTKFNSLLAYLENYGFVATS